MCWVCPCGAGWRASTYRAMYWVDHRTEWRLSTVGSCAVAALVELGERCTRVEPCVLLWSWMEGEHMWAMYRVDPCRTEWRLSTVGSCAVAALVELGEPHFLYKCMLSRPNFGAAPALYKKRVCPTTLYSISYILPKDESRSSACYIELCVYRYKSHHP